MTGVLNATSISIRERELGNSNSIEPERSLDNISRGEESSLKSYRDAKLDEKFSMRIRNSVFPIFSPIMMDG